MELTEKYKQWLNKYVDEQSTGNPEVIKELFDENGEYWYGPFYEPRLGLDAIYNHHKNALSHQEYETYKYEFLFICEQFGLAWFSLTLKDLLPEQPASFEGIFQIYLNEEGKCTLFKEWYNFC